MSATTVSRPDHVPGGPAVPRDGVGFGLRFVIATSAGSVLNPVNSLLRTFMYLGAITSAGIIGFAFGAHASDAGLHQLAVILTATSAVLLAGILPDRDLRHRVITTTSAQRPATRHRAAAARAQRR